MPRAKASDQLTPLELELMQVLWDAGPSTVQGVQGRLQREPPLAYTTVQTMLNVLHRKGKVERALVGRAFHYRAAMSRAAAASQAVQDLVARLFGGSAEGLVMNLLETRRLTPERLAAIQRLVTPQSSGKEGDRDPDA